MQYKTIILELIRDRPEMYEQLRRNRLLLAALERYARELKSRHVAWKESLSQTRPGSDPGQIAAEALALALKDSLRSPSPPDESEALSLEEVVAFIRGRTPRG